MKLDEIARLAGVSRTTASYVINGKAKQYRVSDKTVEKVMAVVREHNYHPNAVAAGLRAGRTRSIGLVIPDLENTSYTRIANYLERQARQRGYQLLIACSEALHRASAAAPGGRYHCLYFAAAGASILSALG